MPATATLLRLLRDSVVFVLWCREGDSNPHGLPRRILSAMRLPFRHPGVGVRENSSRFSMFVATDRVIDTRVGEIRASAGANVEPVQGESGEIRHRDSPQTTVFLVRPDGSWQQYPECEIISYIYIVRELADESAMPIRVIHL